MVDFLLSPGCCGRPSEAAKVVDFLLWAFEHGVTVGWVAFVLAIPLVLVAVALVGAQAGARWIAVFWVWRQFLRWLRSRGRDPSGHHGGAGGYSREYLRFMASPEWERQRRRVLRRDHHRCQQCGARRGLEAHHKFYAKPIAATPDRGIVTLCAECHRQAHGRHSAA